MRILKLALAGYFLGTANRLSRCTEKLELIDPTWQEQLGGMKPGPAKSVRELEIKNQ